MDTTHLHDLLNRCANGDQQAFKQLYDATAAKLNGIAYRIMGSRESAGEVLQEACLQIWRNAAQYDASHGEPLTWMASIVRYRAFDRIKSEKRRIEGARSRADDTFLEEISLDLSPQPLDEQKRLTFCLDTLQDTQKQAIRLAYYHGFSRDELANYFDTPVNTVKSWLRRGLGRLQQCLDS